ncbi:MAG: hypothetical protein AAF602_02980, partial [Myxococcota bacterium]
DARTLLASANPGSRLIRGLRDAVAAVLDGDAERAEAILDDEVPPGLGATVRELMAQLPSGDASEPNGPSDGS